MDKLRITEDTPTKLVLEKALTANAIWSGWSKLLINPLLFLIVSFIVLFITPLLNLSSPWWLRSLSNLSKQTWLYWAIAIGVSLIETLFLYMILTSAQKRMVTIDLNSKRVTRVERLLIGIEKKQELALDKVSRILIHCEEVGHHCIVALESQNDPLLKVADNFDSLDASIGSLDALGRKMGALIMRPMVSKMTDSGNLISEETIQP